jgi:hypothetical protein
MVKKFSCHKIIDKVYLMLVAFFCNFRNLVFVFSGQVWYND